MQDQINHPIWEDVLAMVIASLFVSLGVFFFKSSGFLLGGTAGIAVLLTHWLSFSFGQIFFVINLPFYYLAWTRMGMRFTVNTFISVTIVSVFTDYLHLVITLESINPVFSAILGGFLIGTGILIFFRHVSSLGGVGILAKYLQDSFNMNAGKFQMGVDVAIVCVGFFLVSLQVLALSILGAVALTIVIAINHKPGRYQIT